MSRIIGNLIVGYWVVELGLGRVVDDRGDAALAGLFASIALRGANHPSFRILLVKHPFAVLGKV